MSFLEILDKSVFKHLQYNSNPEYSIIACYYMKYIYHTSNLKGYGKMKVSKIALESKSLLGFRLIMGDKGSLESISSKIGQPQPKRNEVKTEISQKIGSKVGVPIPKDK